MTRSEITGQTSPLVSTPPPEAPPQDGRLHVHVGESPGSAALRHDPAAAAAQVVQRSGALHRPLDQISRTANAGDAVTDLERYKQSMRRFAPVQRGLAGLPWAGTWTCACGRTAPGQLVYRETEDEIYLDLRCPDCGPRRERHHDVLFVRHPRQEVPPRQPRQTYSGARIRPLLTELPRTVETLCPECGALLLGRYFVRAGSVWIEKTCPDHGYFRDKINSDVKLYLKATRYGYQDERGVLRPQVRGAQHCPTDCGLCNQHHSAACLAQIDLTNRCNLTCPVCFASANQAGYVTEPPYELVVEELRTLRGQHPYPATAVQFTGGEPTIHPEFLRIVRTAREMGFSHVQIATNGLRMADPDFAEQAAAAGVHTLYLQFDGLDDAHYRRLRGQPLLETKLRVIENCRATGLKICFVPTIVKTINQDQVAQIFRCAVENVDVVSAISYQPVSFSGRVGLAELEQKRYTLGDLAHDLAACSGADLDRDFFPLNFVTPLPRIMQTLDGKPKIRPSCHADCSFGTYFFVTPEREAIPFPKLFDIVRLMTGFNELAARIEQRGAAPGRAGDASAALPLANWRDKLDLVLTFLRSYRWSARDFRVTPFTFIKALRGMTDKAHGRGAAGRKTYRTLMAAGMHFMDRYNFDTERAKRCVILYSTPDGVYPFCTINCGPMFRPYIEKMCAQPLQP